MTSVKQTVRTVKTMMMVVKNAVTMKYVKHATSMKGDRVAKALFRKDRNQTV